ncbi:HAMP domain-containing histidine kinase [Clostridium botulinum]|nr:sensor histidine kinase [Clostridium botulinum]NFG58252.1 HAMP domain-containing histidine kinase [Clostridium botulinum]NFG66113.1 HAMP domain-containing histidine kinase [Clostridium botulinum]NFQ22769.1 HAMP domain-containing histidine kinase [Clostridium botulinum]
MSLKEYINGNKILILLNLFYIILLILFLRLFNIPPLAIYFLCATLVSILVFYILFSYFIRRNYYNNLSRFFDESDLFSLTELLEEPTFIDGKPFYTALLLLSNAFNQELLKYSNQSNSYQEYIEQWVHEIKTPISSLKLIIETERELLGKLYNEELAELQKIENYIDQTLYYSRMEYSQNDYFVSEFPIMKVIKGVIIKNKTLINKSNISLDIKNSGETIFSDEKWLSFIINQIILNSINYSKNEGAVISIYVIKNSNNIILNIKDNGIGIGADDLPRVFSKGFTGSNGRLNEKSTGLGLYLVKKICEKLEHKIIIDSIKNEYTTVSLIFPKSNYNEILKEID